MEFVVLPYKDYKDTFILGGTDDIQVLLDDSNINISTIASSRHVGPIKSRVDDWVKQLDLFGKTLVGDATLRLSQSNTRVSFIAFFVVMCVCGEMKVMYNACLQDSGRDSTLRLSRSNTHASFVVLCVCMWRNESNV